MPEYCNSCMHLLGYFMLYISVKIRSALFQLTQPSILLLDLACANASMPGLVVLCTNW